MFDLPWLQSSAHVRTGASQWLAEAVATFGLVLVVLGHPRPQDAAWMVAAWICAAYWFTASTSFANPAITIARSLSDTFSGIRPADVPGFIVAQLVGSLVAVCGSELAVSQEPGHIHLTSIRRSRRRHQLASVSPDLTSLSDLTRAQRVSP
jgi:glycerol uptake facilitator-like aquaporin